MLEVLLSWGIILGASLIFGYGFIRLFYGKDCSEILSLDSVLMCGLMLLNVYAQLFSLVYKVGIKACFVLAMAGMALVITYLVTKCGFLLFLKNAIGKSFVQYGIVLICVFITAAWTVIEPRFYDTALYHAHAVRWIEEYGTVCGLGNLHNRFAYNSAFMALQALLSLKWLTGRSLHTLNGFVCCIMLIYAVTSNRLLARKKLQLSDFFKFAVIIYICINSKYISSLSSDIMAMLLVLYVFAKWSEFQEKGIREPMPYAFCCLLCVYAVTVKLSAAAGVLLALYPGYLFISQRKWKDLASHLLAGIIIAVPWLARGVCISGYLAYPYSKLDFFQVDWKMPASVLDYDAMEIAAWGRGLNDVGLFSLPINKWVPAWFNVQKPFEKGLIIAGAVSTVVLLGIIIKEIREHKNAEWIMIAVGIAQLALWFGSAPLVRYGSAFLMIPVAFVLEKMGRRLEKTAAVLCIAVVVPVLAGYGFGIRNLSAGTMVKQGMYRQYAGYEADLGGEMIYLPTEGDQLGYDNFPGTPNKGMLDRIELRGDTLKEGFRIKENCRGLKIQAYGEEWEMQ